MNVKNHSNGVGSVLPPPTEFTSENWAARIERARKAREAGKAAREGLPASAAFPRHGR
jgi:hypothetical protein